MVWCPVNNASSPAKHRICLVRNYFEHFFATVVYNYSLLCGSGTGGTIYLLLTRILFAIKFGYRRVTTNFNIANAGPELSLNRQ